MLEGTVKMRSQRHSCLLRVLVNWLVYCL